MERAAPTVGMSTFGFLYRADLRQSLTYIAEAGYREVEIVPNEPHVVTTEVSIDELRAIRRTLETLGLTCVSVNPPEMNLISPNPEIRALCRRHYIAAARTLAELGGEVLVMVPGRYNGLIAMPEPMAMGLFHDQLGVLLDEARRLGVVIALETTPFGFLASPSALVDVVESVADPHLGITLDVANIFPQEDPAEAVRASSKHLRMVQFSGTWRDRWAHAGFRDGDLDVEPLRRSLVEVGYSGPCIYELVDGQDPVPRIGPDLLALEEAGWER